MLSPAHPVPRLHLLVTPPLCRYQAMASGLAHAGLALVEKSVLGGKRGLALAGLASVEPPPLGFGEEMAFLVAQLSSTIKLLHR